jgi:hypothetical protein
MTAQEEIMDNTAPALQHREQLQNRNETAVHAPEPQVDSISVGKGILWMLGVTVCWFFVLMAFHYVMFRL